MKASPFLRTSGWAALPLLAAIGLVGPAQAGPIDVDITRVASPAAAQAALDGFRSGMSAARTERFESLDAWRPGGTRAAGGGVSTSVGKFDTIKRAGTGGACVAGCTDLQVADRNSGGLGSTGRANVSAEGDNWLDTNDTQGMRWTLDASAVDGLFTHVAFFLSDVADVGAHLEMSFGDDSARIDSKQGNGTINFVTLTFAEPTETAVIDLLNVSGNVTRDGFGIDDATLGLALPPVEIPLPGTLALFVLGLLGFAGRGLRRSPRLPRAV